MTDDEQEMLLQFLAANWYDRRESDAEIVKEYVSAVPAPYVAEVVQVLQKFLNSSQPAEDKSAFIRDAAYRYFPDGNEAPIKWLTGIVATLEQARSQTPGIDS
jgi:hypothetical protein